MYKRSPFQYFNELAVIVGNDIAEGFASTTPLDAEEGHPMNDAFNLLDEDDTNCGTPIDSQPDIDEELFHSNQSSASARGTPPPSSSRRGKRKKTSLSSSLDVICETMKELKDGLGKPQIVKVDKSEDDNILSAAYTALKAVPELSRAIFVKVHDTFMLQRERAKGFLMMDDAERVEWIAMTFGTI